MQVLVLLRRQLDVLEWKKRHHDGLAPDETPYGFHFAQSGDCNIVFSRPSGNSLVARIVQFLLGFDVLHTLKNWDLVNSADIVWTATETDYLSVLFISWLQRRKTPPKLIAQNIFIFNKWQSLSRLHRILFKRLIKSASVLTVHSDKYISVIKSIVPDAQVRLLRFGVSADSFPLTPFHENRRSGPLRIVAAGNDRTRDWESVFKAFGNDERFDVTVATQNLKSGALRPYRNIRFPTIGSIAEFRECYRSADFVVVPMLENLYSGITVALEATALGVPVISSDTGGVPSYFAGDEVIFVPPGDPVALRQAALNTDSNARRAMVLRAQRRFVRDDYTSAGLAQRYLALSRELLDEKGGAMPDHETSGAPARSSASLAD